MTSILTKFYFCTQNNLSAHFGCQNGSFQGALYAKCFLSALKFGCLLDDQFLTFVVMGMRWQAQVYKHTERATALALTENTKWLKHYISATTFLMRPPKSPCCPCENIPLFNDAHNSNHTIFILIPCQALTVAHQQAYLSSKYEHRISQVKVCE